MGCFCLPLPQVTNALLGVVPLARNKITDKKQEKHSIRNASLVVVPPGIEPGSKV